MTPPRPPARLSALEALGALLDRSVDRISEAAADPYDWPAVRRTADVWDNNTLPLFRAAVAPTVRARERRARAALAWMAALGPQRRAWMADRAEEGGFTLDGLMSPEPWPSGPWSSGPVPSKGRLGPEARTTAHLLVAAMLRIRSRPSEAGDQELVRNLAHVMAGAGTAVLAAGERRGRRSREAAFRGLTEEWVRRGDPVVAPWFTRTLIRLDRSDLAPPSGGSASASPWPGPGADA